MALGPRLGLTVPRAIGGAVVRNNGAYSTQLMIETHTPILRCPNILPESGINTPCSRIYMAIELMYIQPERREETMQLYLTLTRDVLAAASSMAPALEEVSRMVADGEWRDYAIDFLKDRAVFSVFRRASEVPIYRIEKDPRLARKQGIYSVISATGLILRRGHELDRVLLVIDRKLAVV